MDLLKARLPLAVVVSAILSVGGLALGAGRAIAESTARQSEQAAQIAAQASRLDAVERTQAEIHDTLIEVGANQHDERERLIRLEGKVDNALQRGR